jgi:TonB family protein
MKLRFPVCAAVSAVLLAAPLYIPAALGAEAPPEEKLSHDQISSTVNAHIADVKACMKEHGSVTGQLIVEFGVLPTGTVVDAKAKQASSNGALDKCIVGAFRKWTFPKRPGGPIQGVAYPLTFTAPKPAPPPPPMSEDEQKQIAAVFGGHLPEVKKCYETALADKAGLEGEIDMDVVIAAGGNVVKTSVKKKTVESPKLEQCLGDAVLKWTFPKHTGNELTIGYPFVFKGTEKKK